MKQKSIEIKNATKTIGGHTIVNDVSLDVYEGEVFGLLGLNGAGKTSLMRMMVGLTKMTKGTIHLKGESITTSFTKAVGHVGAIIEAPECYRNLSGWKNLLMFSRMHKGLTKQSIAEVVEQVGLTDRIHDPVKNYSLGMRQRLGVALALLSRPGILILDEPTNGLDPEGIHEMRGYLQKIAHDTGVTVVVSSHLLSEMELLCDRFAIISHGSLIDVNDLIQRDTDIHTYLFEVNDMTNAERMLEMKEIRFKEKNGQLEMKLSREQAAELNRQLIENNFTVYSVELAKPTLEDYFLNKVAANQ